MVGLEGLRDSTARHSLVSEMEGRPPEAVSERVADLPRTHPAPPRCPTEVAKYITDRGTPLARGDFGERSFE